MQENLDFRLLHVFFVILLFLCVKVGYVYETIYCW